MTAAICGEAVNDGREASLAGGALCRACAGDAYYTPVGAAEREEART